MKSNIDIKRFLDKEGRIIELPAKYSIRLEILKYLAEKFSFNKVYTEKEINTICNSWHTFNDFYILRRSLVEEGFLNRKTDCSAYWRTPKEETNNG